MTVGASVGMSVGAFEGEVVGFAVGADVGLALGLYDGEKEGLLVGVGIGAKLGALAAPLTSLPYDTNKAASFP